MFNDRKLHLQVEIADIIFRGDEHVMVALFAVSESLSFL